MFNDLIEKKIVTDMNGVKLKPGHIVVVHQDEGKRNAIVIEVSNDSPTLRKPGFWVDINDGSGCEGMMSYILEVVGKL
jgi:hypothetical protein